MVGIVIGAFFAMLGAIIRYGITTNPDGIDLHVVGVVLMIGGAVVFVFSLMLWVTLAIDQEDVIVEEPVKPVRRRRKQAGGIVQGLAIAIAIILFAFFVGCIAVAHNDPNSNRSLGVIATQNHDGCDPESSNCDDEYYGDGRGGGDGGSSGGHQGYGGGGGRSGDNDQRGDHNCRNFCFYGIPVPQPGGKNA